MAQNINPISKRLGINKNWSSRWFDLQNFPQKLEEDNIIRKCLEKLLSKAHYSEIIIERKSDKINITIYTSRPGMIIKHQGEGLGELKKAIEKTLEKYYRKNKIDKNINISLNIEEVRKPFLSAQIVAFDVATELEKRQPYRKTIKKYVEKIMQNKEAKGAKIWVSGRLDGADIARDDWYKDGKLPLNTLRSNIDYAMATAHCTYGAIGIKVWIYKGDVFNQKQKVNSQQL